MTQKSSWLTAVPPKVAIEIASGRVTVVELGRVGGTAAVTGYATEPLDPDAVVPTLSGVNIRDVSVVADTVRRAFDRAGLGSVSRAALVVPDGVARVTLLNFEQLPARSEDLEKLIRWQLRKATPFPMDEAQISWFLGHRVGSSNGVVVTVARRDVMTQYEAVADALGVHAGIVDLASFNVMNAVIGAGGAPASDWLLVTTAAEATTLLIGRGEDLMFYRHRAAVDEEPLSALVHQTAMYHEDRLGGSRFSRVWLCGAGLARQADQVRREISERLGVPAETVDTRPAAGLPDRVSASVEVLDTLAAPVGVLLRDLVKA
jgi:Tfp pilus assembly PilM family ATPase